MKLIGDQRECATGKRNQLFVFNKFTVLQIYDLVANHEC